MTRFKSHFNWDEIKKEPASEWLSKLENGFSVTCRGRMWGAAARAWQTNRIFGIGPGMHQNLWPHFAPSTDGDRQNAAWPSLLNNDFHSFEVHNDWLQLLEEYGLTGLVLFLIPAGIMLALFLKALSRLADELDYIPPSPFHVSTLLTGFFAIVCMAFHSLGDFNLQLPATTWMFAVLICIPAGDMRLTGEEEDQSA
jgi:O-antigen ligase